MNVVMKENLKKLTYSLIDTNDSMIRKWMKKMLHNFKKKK